MPSTWTSHDLLPGSIEQGIGSPVPGYHHGIDRCELSDYQSIRRRMDTIAHCEHSDRTPKT